VAIDPTAGSRVPPPVVLEEAWANQWNLAGDGQASVPPGNHTFDFRFTALSFSAPEKLRFRYRLEPADKGWVDAGTSRTAHYTNMPPGKYSFQVAAANDYGIWNEPGASVRFVLKPHFYQTLWFRLVLLAGIVLLAGSIHWLRVRQLRARAVQLKQLVATLQEQADLLNLTHDAIFVMTLEGVIKYWNRGAEGRYGWSAEQVLGKVVHDLLNTAFPAPLAQVMAEVTRTGRWEGELVHTRRDGTQVVVASRWALQRDERGAPLVILETNNDITERKRAQEALRESERKYHELVEHANSIILHWQRDGRIIHLNEFGQRFFGYTESEIRGRHVIGTLVPETGSSGQDLHTLMDGICANPSAFEQNVNENMRRNGERVWIAWTNKVQMNSKGEVTEMLSIGLDVTERKRAEEALRRLNRELRAISNCNQTLLHATDEQSLLQEICRIVCAEAGYRMAWVAYAEHDEARSVRPVARTGIEEEYLANLGISWADTERGRGPCGTAIRSGKTCCLQDFTTDPRLAPWRESALQHDFRSGIALPLKDEHANAFGSLNIYSAQPNAFTPEEIRLLEELAADLAFGVITLRSRAARERAEQEVALLTFALDNVREAAFLVDDRGFFHYANEEACRVLGYTRAELLGMGVADIDPEFPAERWSDHWRQLKAQRSLNFESRHRTRDGRIFPVEISANYFEFGGRDYTLTLVRDITERRRAEEALRRLNRELRAISNCNQTLLHATDEPSLLQEICRIVCQEAGYRVAWVGYAEPNEAQSVRPVAWTGLEEEYLASLAITWADAERGRGIIGTAIRSGKTCCIIDYATDPRVAPWRESALQHGFRSAIALPLKDEHAQAFGSLNIYSAQPNAFTPEEIRMLEELAADLAFGIVTLRSRAARERAEQALRQSEAYLAESERLTHTGSWALDIASDKYVYCSEEDLRIFGFDPQEPLPTREVVFRRIHPEDRKRVEGSLQSSLREMEDSSTEYRIVLPDGTVKHIHAIRHPVLNETGEVVKLVGTSVDITERKQAEEALREGERRFRTFVDYAADALFIYDSEQGMIVDVNRQACESLGYTREELVGTTAAAFHLDSERAQMESVAQRAAAGETVIDTHWHRRTDGTLFPVEVHTSQYWYGGRRFLLKLARDISDRLRAEEERAYLASIVESSDDAIIGRSMEGIIQSWNRGAERLYGYTAQEAIGQPIAMVIPPDRAQEYVSSERLKQGEPIEELETVRVGKDGRRIDVSVIISPMKDAAGRAIGAATIARDITERKRAEEALRRSEAYLADAQRLAHTGAWAGDAAGAPLYWSEEMFRLYGFDLQHTLPTFDQVLQRVHPEDLEKCWRSFQRMIHEKVDSDVEFRIVLPDGTVKHTYGLAHPVLNAHGEVVQLVGTAVDITERKRAEEERERLRQLEAELAHLDRVSMLGELAASIAHEVNQPLSGIVSNGSACLRFLARDTPNVEEAREAARDIVRDGKRAGEIIARIRALTKKAATPREELDLNDTLREVLALVGDEAKKRRVLIRTQFAHDLSPVSGDRVQLQQVVLNLVMNGMEAMSSIVERARELVITTRKIEPDQVQVTVEDSGIGIDAQTIDKIFDSFYTTKPGGMGMGLSISRSIVQNHGGRLWATPNNGPGASFHFTLPMYHEEESHAGV
jgi:PAS domain S-box-containing protein